MELSNILIQSVDWKSLENLIHLDLSHYEPHESNDSTRDIIFRRCPIVRLGSLNKRMQHLAFYDIAINTDDLTLDGNFGFPALKYLSFTPTDEGVPGSNSIALQYCCKNSPKLEYICFNGCLCNPVVYEDELDDGRNRLRNSVGNEIITQSIGPLENRYSLRKLVLQHWTVDDEWTHGNDAVMEMLFALRPKSRSEI